MANSFVFMLLALKFQLGFNSTILIDGNALLPYFCQYFQLQYEGNFGKEKLPSGMWNFSYV